MMLADVTIPYGDWVSSAVGTLQPVATLALTGLASYVIAAYVPPWITALVGARSQWRVNEIVSKAVASAVARTQGIVQGQTVSVPIASDLLAKAVQYCIDQAPNIMSKASMGSLDNLMNMVLARMQQAGIQTADGESVKDNAKATTDFSKALEALGGKATDLPPPPKPKPAAPKPKTLQLGDQGSSVKTLQRKLGLQQDGVYGPATEQAVKSFQSAHGLTPDGVVGPDTWKALA